MKLNRLWIVLLFLLTACGQTATQPSTPTEAVAAQPTSTQPIAPTEVATEIPTKVPSMDAPALTGSAVEDPQFATFTMLTELDGWAMTDSAVLRTDDGGSTWHDVTPPGGPMIGYGAGNAFLDASRAFITAPDSNDPMHAGTLYRTTDGGLTWNMNAIPFGSGMLRFLDSDNGWALAGLGVGAGSNAIAIFQTSDGGVHWTQTFINDPTATGASDSIPLGGLKGVFHARDMQTAWVGGVVYSNATLYLYRTDNGGHDWAQVDAQLPNAAQNAQVSIEEIQFLTPADGFLSLSFTSETGITRAIYVTHDSGDTWTLTPTLIPNGRSVDFVTATDGFVFDGNQFYVTHDACATWTLVKPDVVFSESFMSMDFVNTSTGWVLASDPTTFEANLYKTTDGGASWTPQ